MIEIDGKKFDIPESGVFTVSPDTLKGLPYVPTPAKQRRWWQRIYEYFRPPKTPSTRLNITSLGDGVVSISVEHDIRTRETRSAK